MVPRPSSSFVLGCPGRRALCLVGVIASVLLPRVTAAAPALPGQVRPLGTHVRSILTEGLRHSPTFSRLITRLGTSDVIAYVQCSVAKERPGQLQFITRAGSVRYVRIEADCRLNYYALLSVVGHELQHAVEIAEAPQVVDRLTVRQLYRRIGHSRWSTAPLEFETDMAIDVGAVVRSELLGFGSPAQSAPDDEGRAMERGGTR